MAQEVADYLLSVPRKLANFGSKFDSPKKQDNSEAVKAANETFRKRAESEKAMSKKGVGKKPAVRKVASRKKRTGSFKSYGGK